MIAQSPKPLFVLFLLGSSALSSAAEVPAYKTLELQARSNIVDGYNLPPLSSFSSATPDLNDDATVTFRLITIGGGKGGVWAGAHGEGEVIYTAADDRLVSDSTINNAGLIAFEQFDIFTDGIFVYDPITGTSSLEVPPGGPFGITAISGDEINDGGQIGFRANVSAGHDYIMDDGDVQVQYVSKSGSPYGFLFSSSFNNAAQLAGKVRVGGTGGDQPDEIRVFEADGSSMLMAFDDDGDEPSDFSGFDNSIDLAHDGRVAFIANLVAGGRGVFVSDGVRITTIATTSDPLVSSVSFFPPSMNDGGLVVFRGTDADGLDAIFVGDGRSLIRVVGEHDIVPTDLGPARIDQHDDSVVFGGAVSINSRGDLVFNATLTPPNDPFIEWGSGIFVAYASLGVTGDLDGDGTVGFGDLLILLAAWGDCPAPPAECPADLDESGSVGFGDLLILLAAWR